MTTGSAHGSPEGELVWLCVEDGFYVASCAESFIGFVDRVEPQLFQVCNATSQQIGLFPTLEAATACLTAHARETPLIAEGKPAL